MTTTTTLSSLTGDQFGVNFDKWGERKPVRRALNLGVPSSSIIQPYLPSDNQDLVKACQAAYSRYYQAASFDDTGAKFGFNQHALRNAFAYLDVRDLVKFSKASKCCYLVTKTDQIWEDQLNKFLPKTQFLSMNVCSFSPEQQFKIIFKRINDELKPYITQFNENNETLCRLMGSNEMNGEIAIVRESFESSGGEEALQGFTNAMNTLGSNHSGDDFNALIKYQTYSDLLRRRDYIGGEGYDGTVESFGPNSQKGICLRVIHGGLMVETFNNQDKFESTIQASEALKNNTSQNNGPAVARNLFGLDFDNMHESSDTADEMSDIETPDMFRSPDRFVSEDGTLATNFYHYNPNSYQN